MKYKLTKENKVKEFDYIDQDGISYNSPQEWLWSLLGGCGCGSSDEFAEKAVKLLEYFATDHLKRKWNIYKDGAAEVIAHWMDSKGWIEHGTSIGGSWLTDKGKEILKQLSKEDGIQRGDI